MARRDSIMYKPNDARGALRRLRTVLGDADRLLNETLSGGGFELAAINDPAADSAAFSPVVSFERVCAASRIFLNDDLFIIVAMVSALGADRFVRTVRFFSVFWDFELSFIVHSLTSIFKISMRNRCVLLLLYLQSAPVGCRRRRWS